MASTRVTLLLMMISLGVAACGGGGEQVKVETPKGGGDEPPPTSSLKLPGECVDPVTDGDKHDATRPFNKHVQLDVRTEDLDGDGVVDSFVMPAWSCGIGCNRSAYVVRTGGTCGHYVGTFPSSDKYETLEHKTNGLKDLSTRPQKTEEDGQIHCYNAVLAFNGTEYKEIKRRECECKEEGAKCTAWGS
jgi:hypothetical protein